MRHSIETSLSHAAWNGLEIDIAGATYSRNEIKAFLEIIKKKSARDILIDIANEFQNNYLTIEKFADHNGIFDEHAKALIELAQKVRSAPDCNE